MPRRSASWRSLASRSSGSLTVVRFMVCQHTLPDCSLTAVTANLGVRWRTDDQTRGRFSYSSERRRTTTNTRSAVSKNRRGRCRRSHHRHLAPARVRSGRVADTLTTKLTTKPTENRGMWRSVWHELRQPGNTKWHRPAPDGRRACPLAVRRSGVRIPSGPPIHTQLEHKLAWPRRDS
jgi:hypothetical protein